MSLLPPEVPTGNGCSTPNFGVARDYFKKKYWNDLILLTRILEKQEETRTDLVNLLTTTNGHLITLIGEVQDLYTLVEHQWEDVSQTPTPYSLLTTVAQRLIANNTAGVANTVGQSLTQISDSVRATALTNTLYDTQTSILNELTNNIQTELTHINATLDDIDTATAHLNVTPFPVI